MWNFWIYNIISLLQFGTNNCLNNNDSLKSIMMYYEVLMSFMMLAKKLVNSRCPIFYKNSTRLNCLEDISGCIMYFERVKPLADCHQEEDTKFETIENTT